MVNKADYFWRWHFLSILVSQVSVQFVITDSLTGRHRTVLVLGNCSVHRLPLSMEYSHNSLQMGQTLCFATLTKLFLTETFGSASKILCQFHEWIIWLNCLEFSLEISMTQENRWRQCSVHICVLFSQSYLPASSQRRDISGICSTGISSSASYQ